MIDLPPFRRCARAILVAVTSVLWADAGSSQAPVRHTSTPDPIAQRGDFLPDSAWLLRVGPRVTTVKDYNEGWFSSFAEFRPRPDSAGRVEFLEGIRNKEILGLTALALDTPLDFEGRAVMREHTQRVLTNTLFQRMVLDSVKVSDEEVREVWKQYGYRQHLRHILFGDRATAERARRELQAGRISWSRAVQRFHQTGGAGRPDGDLGWYEWTKLDPDLAMQLFTLKPGEISDVVEDRQGIHLVQVLEREPVEAPSFEGISRSLKRQLTQFRTLARADRFQRGLADSLGFRLDSTNVAFAASRFGEGIRFKGEALTPSIEIEGSLPDFAPEDTGRVLATWRGGRITLRQVMHRLSALSPLLRPTLNTWESFASYTRTAALDPHMAEFASSRGLEHDPIARRLIDRRREQLLVERMYQDSVLAHVRVSPDDERRYYNEHKHEYVTYPQATFAAIERSNRGSADSLRAALEAGHSPAEVLRADSLRTGTPSGSIQQRRKDQVGPYHRVIFEELKPGRGTVVGPDKEGHFAVIHLMEHDPGRQLSFAEARGYVNESLQNVEAERRLRECVGRLGRRYSMAWRPELVMRILLADPANEP